MKNLLKVTLLLAAICIATSSYAYKRHNMLQQQTSVEKIQDLLVMDQKWVPYPDYKDRAGWDKFLGKHKEDLIKAGEAKLDYEWKVVKATDYLEFDRTGDRRIMEAPSGANNSAIATLVFAELAEGKGRFIDQIINGVFHSCEMTSWVASAHLSRQTTRRSLPDFREHVIDLGSGELSQILSWTYFFLKDEMGKVDPVIPMMLKDNIKRRTLDTYLENSRLGWMAFGATPTTMVNNWNVWCNFNVLTCFALLENDPEKLAWATYRTMISVDQFINYTKEDGACEEGPSYWGHAGGKLFDYLQMLSWITNGKVSIFDQKMIKDLGEYISRSYVGGGWVVNFADATAKGGGEAGTIYRYGKAVGSQEMMQYAAYLQTLPGGKGKIGARTDAYRVFEDIRCEDELQNTKPEHILPTYSWYPETEFCYLTDQKGTFLAMKGGFNDESHNHNDAGSFIWYVDQMPVLIDVGVGTYRRQTFSSERYTIWTMQSNFHNLPMVNGVAQKDGKEYKATDVVFDPAKNTFALEIGTAYPAEAGIKSWRRTYNLKDGVVTIGDQFSLNKPTVKNQINFMSWGDIDITKPGQIIITLDGKKYSLKYDSKQFTPAIETVNLDDKRLSNVWGEKIYRISLNANSIAPTGKYTYTLNKL